MIKNLKLNEIISSPLKNKLIKYYNHDHKFISLIGDFFITPDSFLLICSDSFSTSTDLFGFYESIKYKHLFTDKFLEKILNQNQEIQIIQNSFILGSTGNYYHDLIDCYSRIFSYNGNFSFNKKINKIIISETNIKYILDEILSILNIKIPIVCLKKNKIYKFENSIITANKNFKRTVKLYRKIFLLKHIIPSNKLFISRKDSSTRHITKHETGQKVSITSLDELKIKPDYIKVDIEGYEHEFIEGARKTIQKYKPKIAICVYHQESDFYSIPKKIFELNQNYQIFFRHYSYGFTESVMYFV